MLDAPPDVVVARMEPAHHAVVARLHEDSLRSGLFPQLGHRFLVGYYRTFQSSPHAVALVAVSGGAVIGYIVGTTNDVAHYRWVVRFHLRRLAMRAVLSFACRPALALRVARTRAHRYAKGVWRLARHRPQPTAAAEDAPSHLRRGVLTHMVVVEDRRGTGVGSMLVDAFVDRVAGEGPVEIRVTTSADPTGPKRFYERLGWREEVRRTDSDGQPVVRLLRVA